MYFLLVIPIVIVVGALYCYRRDASFNGLDRDEHPLYMIYPLAAVIYDLICKQKKEGIFGNTDVLREIYVDEQPGVSQRKQGCKYIASVLAVIGLTFLVCFAYVSSRESVLYDENRIKRNEAGRGTADYSLVMESDLSDNREMKIRVSERELTGEELEKLKADTQDYLDRYLFPKNESAECVRGKLNLISAIPGTSVSVRWPDDNSWFLSTDGTIKNKDYEEPVSAALHAELTYFDETWEYEREIMIYPPIVTEADIFNEELDKALNEADEKSRTDEYYELPVKVGESTISWDEEKDSTLTVILFLGLVAAGVVLPAMKQDIKKKQKLRTEQMMQDYPDIISKFVMLITAGMTCRGAWNKICSDYVKKKEREDKEKTGHSGKKRKKSFRYAYEEMLISDREMQLGIPEIKVYERFGTRCSVAAYNRFGTLLARNIKRGSAGIIDILESESKESFAERRENVRKKGEETGTKLLLPMFGMLILVIAIVVVPAFSSFNF